MAENPTSSSTIYTTFGAPSGAFGGSNGAQSGTESLISTLIVPLNGSLTSAPLSPEGVHRLSPGIVVPEKGTPRRYPCGAIYAALSMQCDPCGTDAWGT